MIPQPDLGSRPHTVQVERRMAFTPETLYKAWTQKMDHWFAAPGTLRMGTRVGEPFYFATEFHGELHPHYGRFLDLDPYRRLALTWITTATQGCETVVEVNFVPDGDGTVVKLSHRGFPNEELRARHETAWPVVLEQKEKALKGQ